MYTEPVIQFWKQSKYQRKYLFNKKSFHIGGAIPYRIITSDRAR